ncbi:MAG: carbohydrate ABC transporter permease [candidate division NC10 bacterium]|nr:carbohydrate ABC transporter permease [candidate division NC10 bacterium]
MFEKQSLLGRTFFCIILVVAVTWTAFPFYWGIITSLKDREIVSLWFSVGVPWVSFTPTLENWVGELLLPEMQRALLNSITAAFVSTVFCLIIGSMAGYALARFRFERIPNKDITIWFFSLRVLPPVAVAIPFFIMMKNLQLLDTRTALVLSYTTFNLPFAVIIMRSLFLELPPEMEEAALVDGYTRFGAFFRVALPLSTPALVSTALICLAAAWNEFLFALFLASKNSVTIPVLISGGEHSRGVEFWMVATRGMLAILPPALMALLVQRFIVRGLTFGAVKG